MSKGIESDFTFPEKQFAKSRIAGEIGSQYQSIYKKSDQRFRVRCGCGPQPERPPEYRWTRCKVEKRFEYGEHHHEQRCPPASSKFRKMVNELSGNG